MRLLLAAAAVALGGPSTALAGELVDLTHP